MVDNATTEPGRKRLFASRWVLLVLGVLLGALIVLAIRFATYTPANHVHYHANFAVYIHGQHEQFKDPSYYQEVAICSADVGDNPKARVHMHDNVNDVIHVHDAGVTWGNFFENIGWSLSSTALINKSGTVYAEDAQNKLHLVLNGQDYTDLGGLANTVIRDKDRLLISYGDEDQATVMAQFKTVAKTAAKVDQQTDPKSCGGQEDTGFSGRLHHLF